MQVGRILQLDPLLSNQIAAGEVVERPASIVKELVENSVDAMATKIEIDVGSGGKQYIIIRDNGCGIVKEDLALAFSRHATSKIHQVSDLAKIITMGFRGEALASIASVAKCRLTSRTKEESNAWQIEIDNQLNTTIAPAAHPLGTTVEANDLFYNTPARRKFLRSEKTELQAIEEVVKRLALAYPHISILLKQEHKILRNYPGISDLISEKARIGKICGQHFLENALDLQDAAVGLLLRGFVGLPSISKRQADCQYFFVNQRAVRDRLLNHAVKTIYQETREMLEGTYPCYVLYLTLDPREVDVNVHPTKQEVRFRETRLIHDFIGKGLRKVLTKPKEKQIYPEKAVISSYAMPCQKSDQIKRNLLEKSLVIPRYTLLEQEKGVYLISLSSAKKRVLAQYFLNNKGNIPQKPLLFPLKVERNLAQKQLLILSTFGFYFKKEASYLLLLQQPAFLQKELFKESFETFIANIGLDHAENSLALALAELLSVEDLAALPSEISHPLLEEWIDNTPKGPWVYYRHEDMLCEK